MNKTPFLLSYQVIVYQSVIFEWCLTFRSKSLNLAYLPRVDGVFLTDNPQQLVLKGSVARLPLVTGDCDDEGT